MSTRFSRGARKAETREALLRAAARLFATDGIDSTSLERIASELGLTKGAVYAHFGSKKELVSTVLDAFEGDPLLLQMRSPYFDETRPFEERMGEVARLGAQLVGTGVYGLSSMEAVLLDVESVLYALRDRDPEVIASTRRAFDEWGARIDGVQAARKEPLPIPGATLRLLLYNVFRGLVIAHAQSPELVPPEVFEDAFTKVAEALVGSKPKTRRAVKS
jgi:AcrR family transcriptional regulator